MKSSNTFIVHPKADQVEALKAFMKALKIRFEESEIDEYNPEFVANIKESEEEYKKGNYISIEKKDIRKFLDLE